jgi:flagellar hook assembly protein FlgD
MPNPFAFRRLGRLAGLLLAGLWTASGAAQTSPTLGHWQLQLTQLDALLWDEGNRDDEPYVIIIGFQSTIGVQGSTVVSWNGSSSLFELEWDDPPAPDVIDIPPAMGVFDFGPIDSHDGPIGVAGAVIVVMESDNTPFSAVADVIDGVAAELERVLFDLIENGNIDLSDPDAALEEARRRVEAAQDQGGSVFGDIFQFFNDDDDLVGIQTMAFLFGGLGPGVPPQGAQPWEKGQGPFRLGELRFDFGVNAIPFDGHAPGNSSDALYHVAGRLTSITMRAGQLAQPGNGARFWSTVPLSVELCPGCHPIDSVRYSVRYDSGDGRGRQLYDLGFGDPNTPDFSKIWNVVGNVPTQHNAEITATFSSNSFGGQIQSTRQNIGLRVDTVPPTGQIVDPAPNSTKGRFVRIAASVSDAHSGVDRVEFWTRAGSGPSVPLPTHGTAANNYAVTWDSASAPQGPVTLGGTVYDRQGNSFLLPQVSITVDRTAPTVALIYPSPDLQSPSWITSSISTMLRATASDPSGVQGVSFLAGYVNAQGVYVEVPVGTVSTPNANGEYLLQWNVSSIPDQVRPTGGPVLFVEAAATDSLGNTGYATGWIAGFDRSLPSVQLLSPANGPAQGSSVSIQVQASDTVGAVVNPVQQLTVTARLRQVAGGPWTTIQLATLSNATGWSGSLDVSTLPDQTLSITAEAVDQAGNRNSSSRSVTIDRSPPGFVGVSHSPDPFYANGTRSMSFNFTLTEFAPQVTISVLDSANNRVHAISLSNVNTDPKSIPWNGQDGSGALLPSGTYSYTFEAIDSAGNAGQHPGGAFTLQNDTTPPAVAVSATPDPFSLASGQLATIEYSQDENARAEIEILDGAVMVRYLGAWTEKAGTYQRAWDGTNAAGSKVAVPRTYTIRVRVADPAGNLTTVTGTLLVTP